MESKSGDNPDHIISSYLEAIISRVRKVQISDQDVDSSFFPAITIPHDNGTGSNNSWSSLTLLDVLVRPVDFESLVANNPKDLPRYAFSL